MSFQNCTLQCADPGNGESYWVSFEEKSFSKGDDFKVYSGRMNGIGPKSGDKCVVKVFRRGKGTENMCRCEVKKCQQAKTVAKAFNNLMQEKKVRIKFTTLYWAQMDEVSKIKQLFFSGERKLSTEETVLFEDDLRVNEDKPGKHRELTLFMDCQGKKKHCIAKDLEAFAHFTYHLSNGQHVLCGLDGIQDEEGFFLKTPVIHSRGQQYGSSDRGLRGILEVFGNHVCNDFCKDMMKPKEDINHCTEKIIQNGVNGECCTTHPSIVLEQDYGCPQIVSFSHRRPLERQDSVISRGSVLSDYPLTMMKQGSNASEVTESFSGYLEPSAPVAECSEVMFEPTPPPYSSVQVANWLLHEYAQNSFINCTPFEPLPPARTSFESGLGASIVTPSERSSLRGISMDLNANFPEEDADTSGVSTSGCFEDCDGRAASVQCDKKRVRFSLSGEGNTSTAPSDSAISVDSESPTGYSAMTSGVSSERVPLHRFVRYPSDRSFSHTDSQDFSDSFQLFNADWATPICGTVDATANHNPRHHQYLPESPPSYIDSEMATAWWIMRRECISENLTVNTFTHTDNGHASMAVTNGVHNAMVSSVETITSAQKKSQPQQVSEPKSS
ncbi:unnamed protein product [Candidula unifasciata]|uniref:Alpha-type protein kinase domain-containing protein n=1 Tax=Candidula unifasciata TaxID=100452 RepID=A0A8S3YL66_9EUPU|nr:unnamed protein product [Candidula unifasciata]